MKIYNVERSSVSRDNMICFPYIAKRHGRCGHDNYCFMTSGNEYTLDPEYAALLRLRGCQVITCSLESVLKKYRDNYAERELLL